MLGHTFREQLTSDFGVDAHVEIKRDGHPTGRLIGLQLKTGKSHFGDESDDGWKFRPEKKHIPYWVGHSLPMYVLLVDKTSQTIYWQELSTRTLELGPRGGIYVLVPKAQTLPTASEHWEIAAEQFAQTATADFEDNLSHLSPATARGIRSIATRSEDAAALLAAHVARGRGAPEVVIRTLLDSEPAWLGAAGPSTGLAALGEYAHSHDLEELAVEAVLAAAARDPGLAYRYIRNAGLMLLETDPGRARDLLSSARAMDAGVTDLRLDVGQAILDHPQGSAAPVAIGAELEAQLRAVDDDEFVLSFLARRHEHAGDLDSAVKLSEKALDLAPDSVRHMEALASALGRRARTSGARPADQKRSITLAADTLDQIHRWSGPTDSPLRTLLTNQMAAGQFANALDRSLPSPGGRATSEEAQRPSVRAVAATAAAALGKKDLAADLIDALPPGLEQDLARLRFGQIPQTPYDERKAWLDLVSKLDESQPEALVQAVMRLSDLGVDESVRLDMLVAQNMVSSDLRSLASVVAAMDTDFDAHLPRLRILAERDELASAKLVDLLISRGRLDDAEVAADTAFSRFGKPEFAVRRGEVLAQLKRDDEAQVAANDALNVSTIDPIHRRIAHRLLARLLINQAVGATATITPQMWRRIERQLMECIDSSEGLTAEDRDVWQLADAQMRLGEADRAFQTVTNHDPTIASASEARLWTSVMVAQPASTQRDYARMIDLADQFKHDAQLSAAMLTVVITRTRDAENPPATPVDDRAPIHGDLRAAAFAALHDHVARHGEDSPIKMVRAPTTEELIDKMTDLMRRDDAPLVELVEMIRQARLPLGMLSVAGHRPYASTIALRPMGYFISAAAIEDDDLADEQAARAALGQDVVLDTSTMFVASATREYESLRGGFRSLLLAGASRNDIRQGRIDMDGRSSSSGCMAYDSATGSIAATDLDIDEHLATLSRFETIEAAVSAAQVVPNVSLEELEVKLPGAEPWLAPIALAKAGGLALWSDDLAQRRLARAMGISAFGTTTLQQIRTADRLEDQGLNDDEYETALAARRQEVLRALTARIVDVPTDSSLVIEHAMSEEWNESAALVTIGRPGWWHMAVNPWQDLHAILRAAEKAGAATDAWRYHAMWGVARLASDDPIRVGTLLACVALLTTKSTLDDDEAVRHLRAAIEIATVRRARPPTDLLTEAATTLATAGMLTYAPEDTARLRAKLAEPPAVDEPPTG
jgi:tetratricopeptide (TPR) repeat protein